jgi:hypothetical protein
MLCTRLLQIICVGQGSPDWYVLLLIVFRKIRIDARMGSTTFDLAKTDVQGIF